MRLIDSLSTTDELAAIFSDASILDAMLAVEAALARVQARAGLIPPHAADVITACAHSDLFDAAALAREARDSATLTIPLVHALRTRVGARDADAASFVHWGATSQDVSDTALVLLLVRARDVLARDHARLQRALRALSDAHASTVMVGRTLLQPAPPVTFGLKVAGWYGATARNWWRLSSSWDEGVPLQFGGAVGTMAALGDRGPEIATMLAASLGLRSPDAPWHSHRDRLAALVTGCGIYTASLGKIARDISLLMQHEVNEAAEPGGGSSSMPQKKNPSGSAIVLAAATRLPGLVAAFLSGMVQEHERGVGGLQAEWPIVADVVQSTGAALATLAAVVEALRVDPHTMRAHLDGTKGSVFAERAMMLLTPPLGRDAAMRAVKRALASAQESGRSFAEALREIPDVSRALPADVLERIDRAEDYLGAAETLRLNLLKNSQGR
jgi:3-carboxy-cis,cis-muconate cycloisomerase